MKNLIYILLILFLDCSSSDDDSNVEITPTIEVAVTTSATTIEIDQVVTLTATTNEPISEIRFSLDGGDTFPSAYGGDLGTTANLYFSFDTLGAKSIIVRVKNAMGDIVDTNVTVQVEQGNAIHIQSLQLNAFNNMGNTWDSEYPTTDPNHLADVYFAIRKREISVFTGEISTPRLWYLSEIKENEGDLYWDLQNEDLYMNPFEVQLTYIAFGDYDGDYNNDNSAEDLMLGVSDRYIPFDSYTVTQPNAFTVQEDDINLEYTMTINW